MEEGLSCGVGSSSGESADEGETTLRGPSVVRGSARFQLGYEFSCEESSEVENILGGMNMDESTGEEPVSGEEGISVGGQSLDDDNGVVLEKTVGNWY